MGGSDNYSIGSTATDEGETRKQCLWRHFKANLLIIFLVFGIIAGVCIGIGVRQADPDMSDRNAMYIGFPGDIFLRMLKCCIIPMIVTSLISSMAGMKGKAAGRMGGVAVLYYMITTVMAVLLGILLVTTIRPGERKVSEEVRKDKDKFVEPVDSILDLIRNCFPPNIIEACLKLASTVYDTSEEPILSATMSGMTATSMMGMVDDNVTMAMDMTPKTIDTETIVHGFSVQMTEKTNVLGLVVFSIVLGLVVGNMGEQGLPVKNFVDSLQEAILRIVILVIWLSPIGLASILAKRIIDMDDPALEFEQLGWYIMTVLVGLGIHGLIVLPTIYLIFTRQNPVRLFLHMGKALLTALGTASSSATLPVTIRCLEENAEVDPRVSRFVLPVGATINMDGTALYEAVASIFIAQINFIDLDAGQVVTVCITATAAAIGAAGIPEAGLVTMVIVLTAVGLPTEDIGLIFAVDWFLDRFRTMINVWGDSIGAGVVQKLAGKSLEEMDRLELEHGKGKKQNGYSNGGLALDEI